MERTQLWRFSNHKSENVSLPVALCNHQHSMHVVSDCDPLSNAHNIVLAWANSHSIDLSRHVTLTISDSDACTLMGQTSDTEHTFGNKDNGRKALPTTCTREIKHKRQRKVVVRSGKSQLSISPFAECKSQAGNATQSACASAHMETRVMQRQNRVSVPLATHAGSTCADFH